MSNTVPVLVSPSPRISRLAAERTPRFPGSRPLVGYVRDHLVRVWPLRGEPCRFYDRRHGTDAEYCSDRGVRYCPQCDGYLCLKHSRGGVSACCHVHAWESTWDPHEHGGVGVIDVKTRVLISLGGEYVAPHEVYA